MGIIDTLLGVKRGPGGTAASRIENAQARLAKADELGNLFEAIDKVKADATADLGGVEAELANLKALELGADPAKFISAIQPEIKELVAIEKRMRAIAKSLTEKLNHQSAAAVVAIREADRLGVRNERWMNPNPTGSMFGHIGRAIDEQRTKDGEKFAPDVGMYLQPVRH